MDLDYENIRTTLKGTKRNVTLSEYLQGIREREDDLERHSSQARKSEKISRVFNHKNPPEEKEAEPPSKIASHSDRLVLPRHLAMKLGDQK